MAFDQVKTAQIAAQLMRICGSPIEILKLMKLLYLVDREAMDRFGFPVTGDRMVSMPHGPVLSQTLDLINGAQAQIAGGWDALIADRSGRRVALKNPGEVTEESLDELSETELQVIKDVADRFGQMSAWDLRQYTHRNCPEWVDPCGSSKPIQYEDVFLALGKDKEQSQELAAAIQEDDAIDRMFASL